MTRVHLIGVCGTAMATLAALLKSKGFDVRGSDQNVYPPMSDFLVEQGITLLQGYRPEHITADLDLVVVGNAISRGNPELEEVLDRKIRYCSLPEAVRDHFLWAARSVVIAGTHGKTTTTALTGWVLTDGGVDPSLLVGGIAENFDGSYRIGGGREFVIEGDEYDSAFFDKTAKFLKYLPDIAVVGNIEFDHADIYADLDAIRLTFARFVNLIPRRGPPAARGRQRGRDGAAHARPLPCRDVRPRGRRRLAGARSRRRPDASTSLQRAPRAACQIGTFEVPLLGAYNVRNALAAIAVGAAVGLSTDTMVASLQPVQGRAPAHAAPRHRAGRRRLRRLRAPSDRHRRNAGRRPLGLPGPPHLGDLRAALGDVVPPRISGGLRPRALRRRPRHPAGRVPFHAARRRAAVDRAARRGPQVRGRRRRAISRAPTTSSRPSRTRRRDGDLVVIMSNGGFDDIHRKLLAALERQP